MLGNERTDDDDERRAWTSSTDSATRAYAATFPCAQVSGVLLRKQVEAGVVVKSYSQLLYIS